MKVTVGITGASGSVYALRLIEHLHSQGIEVAVVSTDMGVKVCQYETKTLLTEWLSQRNIQMYDVNNLFAPPSSGTHRQGAVIIIPCSMGTLGRIAQGISSNLLERVADVALKERFTLILCPRETPLNHIHLENMLKVSRSGGIIAPLTIGFYTKPASLKEAIDFHIGKLMDLMGIRHNLFVPWGVTGSSG